MKHIKNLVKRIIGLLCNSYIKFMSAKNKEGKWLDRLTFRTYRYLISFSVSEFLKSKTTCEKTALRRISNKSIIKFAFEAITSDGIKPMGIYRLFSDEVLGIKR